MLQDYDFTVSVSQTRQIDAPGDYLYYYSGNAGGADTTLRVRGLSSGMSLRLAPGQSFRLPAGQRETAWVITPSDKAQPLPIVGVLVIGAGELGNNRITGSVEVVEGGKARTLAGAVFGSRYFNNKAGAGQRNWCQWFNPVGSGKRMVVSSWSAMSSDGIKNAIVGVTQTQFANLFAAVQWGTNKYAGSNIATVMEKRWQIAPGNPAGWSHLVQVGQGVRHAEQEPVIIPPGWSIGIINADDDSELSASIHWIEESL